MGLHLIFTFILKNPTQKSELTTQKHKYIFIYFNLLNN